MSGKKPIEKIKAGAGEEDATQRNMLALKDVEYIISAEIDTTDLAHRPQDTAIKYASEFKRRASLGKCFHRPGLGMREFAADFEAVDDPQKYLAKNKDSEIYQEDLGIMLYDVFSPRHRHKGFQWIDDCSKKKRYQGYLIEPKPCYFQAKLKDSVIDCDPSSIKIIYPQSA